MKRIDTSTRAINLFGVGKDGFKDGDLASGVAPTDFNASWVNNVQEEIANVVESAGLALSGADRTQLLQALHALVGTGRLIGIKHFYASAPYVRSAAARFGLVLMCGGGGGGAAGPITAAGQVGVGSGGGGGTFALAWVLALASGPVVVGAGGPGGSSQSTNFASAGSVGGSTTFAGVQCQGGAGGLAAGPANAPYNGQGTAQGVAATGPGSGVLLLLNIAGSPGGITSAISASAINAGNGGPGPFGGGGNASPVGGNGANATALGAGGGGACTPPGSTGGSGGSGGPGFVIVLEFS